MWVSLPELVAVLGRDRATALCNSLGGVPVYVPQEARSGHPLAGIVGLEGMEALCKSYKGEYITPPGKGGRKERILEMLEQGMKKREIALACGVSERYVYRLAGLHGSTGREEQPFRFLGQEAEDVPR